MRIRTMVITAVAIVVAGGGAANAAGPSLGVSNGGGGISSGGLRYVALATRQETVVARIDATDGTVQGSTSLRGDWGTPVVAIDGATAGVSGNGRVLVLGQNSSSLTPARSRFAILNPVKMRLRRVVTLPGAFSFDALSPDGRTMYLIQHSATPNVLSYAVRAYDLRRYRLEPGVIVDKRERSGRMVGFPLSRAVSGDGVWAYTLYQKPSGAMFIHALDTATATAHCVDVPGRVSGQTPGLSLSGRDLEVVSVGQVLARMSTRTFKLERGAPPTAAPAGHMHRPAQARSGGHTAAIVAALAAAVGAAVAAGLVGLRRRSRTGARSGGAGAGAPSAP